MIATSTPPLISAAILAGSYAAIRLLDQIAFGWLDLDSPRFEVGDAAVQLLRLSRDLEQHPTLVTSHVGAADVGHQRELLAELVDHRLLHHGRAKDQLQPPPPHTRSLSPVETPGHRGNDRDLVLLVNFRTQARTEPHVLIIQVDVDELAQLATLVEQTVPEAGVASVQSSDCRPEVCRLHVNCGLTF